MAVTITRSIWIDDDGTGTTGTVINQALHTTLYNEIDAALAKVAQLAGGNTFTGNQTITGLVIVSNPGGTHSFSGVAPAAVLGLRVQNTSPAANSAGVLYVGNDADPNLFQQVAYSSGTSAGSYIQPNGVMLYAGGAGGLSLLAGASGAALRFYTGGTTERLRITSTGDVLAGVSSLPFSVGIGVVSDATVRTPLVVQNSSAANSGNLVTFVNSAVGICGSITQSGATTVVYGTSSDARLKDDDGRAMDVTALRAVVVHDFTWKADGRRARGVFAQEARVVFPLAVVEGTDETTDDGSLARPWMTDYSKFVPDLIVGWQQHDAAIAELRAALAAAKG